MNINIPSNAEELYRNSHGCVYQCDLTNKIYIEFGESLTAFRINNFLNFKQLVDKIDIHTMIFNLSDEYDYEVVQAPHSNTKYVLTLCEIINLRELLIGAKFAMYVNRTINELFEVYV